MLNFHARAVVTDIEGTTTDIAFVHQVLFPYARQALPQFVREHQHQAAVAEQLQATQQLAETTTTDVEELIRILIDWIDQDRKATPLKALQGLIWRKGYENGDFTGHVYPDAFIGLNNWKQNNLTLCVYSSGSIAAQQLLFGNADMGDMRALFSHWFDTTTGPKKEPESYRKIAATLALPADQILFLSDVVEELDAAHCAGMQTVQLCREPNMTTGQHPSVGQFNEISIQP